VEEVRSATADEADGARREVVAVVATETEPAPRKRATRRTTTARRAASTRSRKQTNAAAEQAEKALSAAEERAQQALETASPVIDEAQREADRLHGEAEEARRATEGHAAALRALEDKARSTQERVAEQMAVLAETQRLAEEARRERAAAEERMARVWRDLDEGNRRRLDALEGQLRKLDEAFNEARARYETARERLEAGLAEAREHRGHIDQGLALLRELEARPPEPPPVVTVSGSAVAGAGEAPSAVVERTVRPAPAAEVWSAARWVPIHAPAAEVWSSANWVPIHAPAAEVWSNARWTRVPEAGEAPNGNGRQLGLTVDGNAVVVEVEPGSPADAAGARVGDLVVAVNGQTVLSGQGLRDAIARAEPGGAVTLRVARGSALEELRARLAEPAPVTA
jgi:hypothetical protein